MDSSVESQEIQSLNKRMKYFLTGVAICLSGLACGGLIVYLLFGSWQLSKTHHPLGTGKVLPVKQPSVGQAPKRAATQESASHSSAPYANAPSSTAATTQAPRTSRQPSVTSSQRREIGVRE